MPQLDKTGPQGQGPMTGRGIGPCSNRPRRGFGLGRLSCCVRERFFSRKNEQASLEEEKKMLEEELKAVQEEIEASKDNS